MQSVSSEDADGSGGVVSSPHPSIEPPRPVDGAPSSSYTAERVSDQSLASGARGDWHAWAHEMSLYVDQNDLVAALKRGTAVVVDVRDVEDRGGGRVRGAVSAPDATFSDHVPAVRAATKALSDGGRRPEMVCFHCMESARRGPRCARHLLKDLLGDGSTALDKPAELAREEAGGRICPVRVLRGGADQWIRRFWLDSEMVEEFDDDYWGWDVGTDSVGREDGFGGHVGYTRPSDQPGTEWSPAGSEAT